MFRQSVVISVLLASRTVAQNSSAPTTTAWSASNTISGPNVTATATSKDISIEELWDKYVGPVQVASITTTVSPTPIASAELVPPPPLFFSPLGATPQVPAAVTNSSWKFPSGFWWGVASAAYQVEGAAKTDGRGPSIWDVLLHSVPGFGTANQTGDVADNHYYLYKQDIARIAALGVKAYSFSISWSRVYPYGRGQLNEIALAHYEDVIDTCIQYGVEPVVTIYHWDLPLYLQLEYGGWLSEDIVPDFVNYASTLFTRFGEKVSKWVTVNEPIVFCRDYPLPKGYFSPTDIPDAEQPWVCGQSVLLAHAQAYHAGKQILPGGATISFKTNGGFKIPMTSSPDDLKAAERAWDYNEGWFADPVFLGGEYPASVSSYTSSFLRPLNGTEKGWINGSCDIFMHDGYTSSFNFAPEGGVDACAADPNNPSYPFCSGGSNTYSDADGGWNIGYAGDPGTTWLNKATEWVPALLHYIQDRWHPKAIAISEFGFSEPFEEKKQGVANIRTDLARSVYYHDYMQAVLIAISEGVNVVGTLAWSIMDNLEWSNGYEVKFGMQYVDFATQQRYFKASFFHYVDAFKKYGTDPVEPRFG